MGTGTISCSLPALILLAGSFPSLWQSPYVHELIHTQLVPEWGSQQTEFSLQLFTLCALPCKPAALVSLEALSSQLRETVGLHLGCPLPLLLSENYPNHKLRRGRAQHVCFSSLRSLTFVACCLLSWEPYICQVFCFSHLRGISLVSIHLSWLELEVSWKHYFYFVDFYKVWCHSDLHVTNFFPWSFLGRLPGIWKFPHVVRWCGLFFHSKSLTFGEQALSAGNSCPLEFCRIFLYRYFGNFSFSFMQNPNYNWVLTFLNRSFFIFSLIFFVLLPYFMGNFLNFILSSLY